MADSALLAAFAGQAPERFATLLADGTLEERLGVFTILEPEAAAAVAARLGRRELTEVPEAMLLRWAEEGAFDDAVTMLGRLGRHEALGLIEQVADVERRRRLLQFLLFPPHSLGSITSADVLQVPERATIRELLRQLRKLPDDREHPVVTVDDLGRVSGVLDLWRLLLRVDGGVVRDCMKPVSVLRPEISIEAALAQPGWAGHQWRPVVDQDQRLVGVVTHDRLLAVSEPQRDPVPIGEGIVELGNQFVTVSADMLGELIGRDAQ